MQSVIVRPDTTRKSITMDDSSDVTAPRQTLFEVLLVEDSRGDARLMELALQQASSHIHMSLVSDGEQALRYLRREEPYQQALLPSLIFLDLNLPKLHGREVLAEIKEDPALLHIPVIVLTTSSATHDVDDVYRLHANGYVTKPVNVDDFFAAIKAVVNFWFSSATLPSPRPPKR